MKANSSARTTPGKGGTTPKKKPNPASSSSKNSPSVIIEDKFPGLSLQSKPKRPIRTGFMYDEAMLDYNSLHDENYLDSPDRISTCYDKCKLEGLVKKCIRLKVNPCTDEELFKVHDCDYVEKMKSTSQLSDEELMSMEHGYHNAHFNKNSMQCARLSAGAAIGMMKAIASDQVTNGIAIVRPPGHHASRDEACGLCLFNNVAIAASHCLTELSMDKILIIDWDVHHGQGTQRMFYDDPRVMYISIHRYEHGWFWPNLRESDYDHIGEGKGRGYNINVPLNKTGMTDSDYLTIFHQLIMPVATEFNPSAVIVSAGYDCALGCPEGEMTLSPPVFSHFVHMLRGLADGRLALILEGGYHLTSLSESVAASVRGLLDNNCPKLAPTSAPQPELVNVVLNCINLLRPHWQCFQYQAKDHAENAIDLKSSNTRGPAPFVDESPAYHDLYKEVPQPADVKQKFTEQIKNVVKAHPTRVTISRSCYVYDTYMMKHRNAMDMSHPERPERISRIHDMLGEYGLLEKCVKLPSRQATKQELSTVHSSKHIAQMTAITSTKPKDLVEMARNYNSIYIHPESYTCALLAAGSLLNVVDSVMADKCRNGFAIIRPPGHHAEQHEACGFCLFNNVPVAAKYAQEKHSAKRIVIVDWDVHHGNGTQHMFESDDSVLYISLHRYDDGSFFPGGAEGNLDKVGKGKGAGYNVNIPFNQKYDVRAAVKSSRPAGDPEYIAAFQQIVMPICYEFSPDLVFISAGFDAAKGDPLGGYRITPGGYAHMTHMLSSLANGRLIMALEGGYNLNSISESFSACVDVMLGGVPPRITDTAPDSSAVQSIKNVIGTHKKYWKSLCCDVVLPYNEEDIKKLQAEEDDSQDSQDDDEDITNLTRKLLDAMLSGTSKPSGTSASTTPSKPASEQGASQGKPPAENTGAASSDSGAKAEDPQSLDISESSKEAGGAAAGPPNDGASASTGDDGLQAFCITPLSWCAHLEDIQPLAHELDTSAPCLNCANVGENWVCLTCYKVCCSRYINEHMLFHSIETDHKMVLSYADLSVWCYACDSYVHHLDLIPMKNSAHMHKFGSLAQS